jgi:2-polyprenyl-6-methoxyphenol hydroxylase-like FAD-dependent oxidoreductase
MVIGGGIAGPVAAMALQTAGIEATVYERYPSTAEGIGGMLMVQPNGLNALGVIGLQAAVSAIGQPIERSVIADGRGKQLMEMASVPGLPASQLMWRSDVYRVIRQAALDRGIDYQDRVASLWRT